MPTKRCRVFAWDSDVEVWSEEVQFDANADPLITPSLIKLLPPEGVTADTVELEILEAGTEWGCGLQAVEVFSEDFVPTPSDTPVTVSEDLYDLPVGSTVFYRVVCRTEEESETGPEKSISLPSSPIPIIHSLELWAEEGADKIIKVRCNPMGNRARLEWRQGGEGTWTQVPVGWDDTTVDRFITVRPDASSHRRLEVRICRGNHFDKAELDL